MEHLHVFQRVRFLDAGDLEALLIRPRVAAGAHHHADRRAGIPLDGHFVEAMFRRCEQRVEQVRLPTHHQRLAFRIAKPTIKFNHLRASWREHQPGIKHTLIPSKIATHRVNDRHENLTLNALHRIIRNDRHGRIGTHPAGIQTLVTLADGLVILQGFERENIAAIA